MKRVNLVSIVFLVILAFMCIWKMPPILGRHSDRVITKVENKKDSMIFYVENIVHGIRTVDRIAVSNKRLQTYYGNIGYQDYAQKGIYNELLECPCPVAAAIAIFIILAAVFVPLLYCCEHPWLEHEIDFTKWKKFWGYPSSE
jgi:hypothetical protein